MLLKDKLRHGFELFQRTDDMAPAPVRPLELTLHLFPAKASY